MTDYFQILPTEYLSN